MIDQHGSAFGVHIRAAFATISFKRSDDCAKFGARSQGFLFAQRGLNKFDGFPSAIPCPDFDRLPVSVLVGSKSESRLKLSFYNRFVPRAATNVFDVNAIGFVETESFSNALTSLTRA